MIFDLLIIGGGAAGMSAAVFAGRKGLKTAILERQPRVGKKLLATGSGTCNITNSSVTSENYHSLKGGAADFIKPALTAFTVSDTLAFFESVGVMTESDPRGRIYPVCRSAAAVLDSLRMECSALNVIEATDFEASKIKKADGGFAVASNDGREYKGRTVLIAAGGAASPSLGGRAFASELLAPFGVKCTKQLPSLTSLRTDTEFIRAVKGLRVNARLKLVCKGKALDTCTDELQFVDQGLSGPAALNVSRTVSVYESENGSCEGLFAVMDLLPDADAHKLIFSRRNLMRPADELLTGLFQRRVGQTLLRYSGVKTAQRSCGNLTDNELETIVSAVTGFAAAVKGTSGMKDAQVTAGGVDLRQISAETLELNGCKGMYLAGEVLDIDGDCGGYNLQWAWSSAHLAVQSAEKYIKSL